MPRVQRNLDLNGREALSYSRIPCLLTINPSSFRTEYTLSWVESKPVLTESFEKLSQIDDVAFCVERLGDRLRRPMHHGTVWSWPSGMLNQHYSKGITL